MGNSDASGSSTVVPKITTSNSSPHRENPTRSDSKVNINNEQNDQAEHIIQSDCSINDPSAAGEVGISPIIEETKNNNDIEANSKDNVPNCALEGPQADRLKILYEHFTELKTTIVTFPNPSVVVLELVKIVDDFFADPAQDPDQIRNKITELNSVINALIKRFEEKKLPGVTSPEAKKAPEVTPEKSNKKQPVATTKEQATFFTKKNTLTFFGALGAGAFLVYWLTKDQSKNENDQKAKI